MNFIIIFFGWIFSLCLHEFSHALVAYHGGDTTVREKGYLSFNPIRYAHPMMSIVIPMIIMMMGGIGLPGGAVYIERWRIRDRYWLSAMSLAGPAANGLVAFIIIILLQVLPESTSAYWPGLSFLFVLQVWALLFNLLPVPGLDGYGVIEPFLNPAIQMQMERIRPFAVWVLLLAVWYIPFISDFIWTGIYILSAILGVNWDMVIQGQDFLLNFFR